MTLPSIHLSLAERREIAGMHAAKIPIHVIADRLQRHRSTIYREIKRNWVHDEEPLYRGSFHVAADMQARARRQGLSKLSRKPVLAAYVMDRLKAGWSPEQIAGRLRASGAPERLSHETIYRFVYSSQGQKLGLYQDLPMARRRRRARYQRQPRGLVIPVGNTIEQRPAEIAVRSSFGHWEGDLMLFRKELGQHNLTSLVERQSRYTILTRNRDRNSTGVMTGMIEKLKVLPETARLSITFDRGTEFVISRCSSSRSAWTATSASRKPPGRKARSRTPMAGSGASCHGTRTLLLCPRRPCLRSASGSTGRRASAWAIAHPKRS
jgi:IS30 family transposase